MGFGIIEDFSVWFSFQYLHLGLWKTRDNEFGDTFLKIWIYTSDFFRDNLHLGFLCAFRFPTSSNSYINEKWKNISFGNNELKLGPVFQLDINDILYLHLNTFYVFREGENQGFYNGIYLNPFNKKTYTKLFGLNYKSEGAFLEVDRLKNDYIILSLALNTDIFSPIIPYIEFFNANVLFRNNNSETDNISIEGAGINPTLLSMGCRYFLRSTFVGLHYIKNLRNEKKYIKHIIGFDFSLQF